MLDLRKVGLALTLSFCVVQMSTASESGELGTYQEDLRFAPLVRIVVDPEDFQTDQMFNVEGWLGIGPESSRLCITKDAARSLGAPAGSCVHLRLGDEKDTIKPADLVLWGANFKLVRVQGRIKPIPDDQVWRETAFVYGVVFVDWRPRELDL